MFGLFDMLIIEKDGELSSSSDEDPDQRRFSPWFVNLSRIIEVILRLPDHGRLARVFYFPQSYPENHFRHKSDNYFI